MKKIILAISAFLLVAGSVHAAIQTFSTNYSEGNPVSDYNMTLSQFDTLGGSRVLTDVTLTFTAQQSASILFENGTASAFDGAPELFGASVALDGTGSVSLSSALNVSGVASNSFAANGQESGLPTYNGSGDDYFKFDDIISDLYTGSVEKTSDLTAFIGIGNISYDMTSIGVWTITGSGDSNSSVENYLTAGSLTVDYEYSVVPEPATASLLGIAGLIAFLARRHMAR